MLGIVIVGSILNLVVFFVLRNLEDKSAKVAFDNVAEVRFDDLESNVRQSIDNLEAVAGFFNSSHQIERTEFHHFASAILQRDQAIQALEWAPRVQQAWRPSYELRGKRGGFDGFQFTEKNVQGQLVRAAERSQYFPVFLSSRCAAMRRPWATIWHRIRHDGLRLPARARATSW
jgi:CHASE1-domain containing sensor protein